MATNLDTAADDLRQQLLEYRTLLQVGTGGTTEQVAAAIGQVGGLVVRNTEVLIALLEERQQA
jgi:hypothetical protein